ncbi:MAG TPA: hypothetical protein VN039_16895 [Nitrospira sp.]|nr:hypothetical protein [Nitrospira sp.]
MPAKAQSDLSEAREHVDQAFDLVARGGDRVQQAIAHLAIGLKLLMKELDG